MNKLLEFKTILVVSPFGDGKYWYLREELTWKAKSGKIFNVPEGFVTDFASVPQLVWSIFPRWAKYGPAAVVHDYCYWEQAISRKKADEVILEGMEDLGVCWFTRYLIYYTLRAFGWIAWCDNRCQKTAKHIRVVESQDWPTDPTITWKQLQKELESRNDLQ